MAHNQPLAFLFTFTPYGTRLHGDERGSVDDEHSQYETPYAPASDDRRVAMQQAMTETALLIDPAMRGVIEDTLVQHCAFRGWQLLAFNVRTNHVHVVVSAAAVGPQRMLNDLKAYLTRGLRKAGIIGDRKKVWTEGGSKRWLFTSKSVETACGYVRDAQGPDLPRE